MDLPLPSYLRDFKYADNQLLRPHFAHYRRNVGVGSNAEESLEMLRSLSAPPYPSVRGDEHAIVGAYEVAGPTEAKARLPMIALPNRVPLENPVEMKKLRKKEFNSDTQHLHSQSHAKKPIRKKASPEKMGLFLDELTEAYALCSAHEQLTAEMETLQQKASKFAASRGKSKLPELNIKPNGALNMLQTILEARKLNST